MVCEIEQDFAKKKSAGGAVCKTMIHLNLESVQDDDKLTFSLTFLTILVTWKGE